MRKVEKIIVLLIVLGAILLVFGWTQSMPFSADSKVYDEILIKRTIKYYVFVSVGTLLIIISAAFNKIFKIIYNEITTLKKKCSDLEKARINNP